MRFATANICAYTVRVVKRISIEKSAEQKRKMGSAEGSADGIFKNKTLYIIPLLKEKSSGFLQPLACFLGKMLKSLPGAQIEFVASGKQTADRCFGEHTVNACIKCINV